MTSNSYVICKPCSDRGVSSWTFTRRLKDPKWQKCGHCRRPFPGVPGPAKAPPVEVEVNDSEDDEVAAPNDPTDVINPWVFNHFFAGMRLMAENTKEQKDFKEEGGATGTAPPPELLDSKGVKVLSTEVERLNSVAAAKVTKFVRLEREVAQLKNEYRLTKLAEALVQGRLNKNHERKTREAAESDSTGEVSNYPESYITRLAATKDKESALEKQRAALAKEKATIHEEATEAMKKGHLDAGPAKKSKVAAEEVAEAEASPANDEDMNGTALGSGSAPPAVKVVKKSVVDAAKVEAYKLEAEAEAATALAAVVSDGVVPPKAEPKPKAKGAAKKSNKGKQNKW
jgi:hypothetical protein